MYVAPTAPLSIGGVLGDAIGLYRASFRSCWPINLAMALLLGILGVVYVLHMIALGAPAGPVTPAVALRVYRHPGTYGIYACSALVRLIGYGALIRSQYALCERGAALPPLVALSSMPARLLPGIGALALSTSLLLFGLLLLVVPGLWLLVALCVWPVALFAEDLAPVAALRCSLALVRGHWWRTGAVMAVAFILVAVLSTIAASIAAALVLIFSRERLLLQLIAQGAVTLSYVFILSMLTAAEVAVYQDLKRRRDQV